MEKYTYKELTEKVVELSSNLFVCKKENEQLCSEITELKTLVESQKAELEEEKYLHALDDQTENMYRAMTAHLQQEKEDLIYLLENETVDEGYYHESFIKEILNKLKGK